MAKAGRMAMQDVMRPTIGFARAAPLAVSCAILNKRSADPQDSKRLAAHIAGMRNVLIFILLAAVLPARAADRELTLAREMLEDTILRDDAEGMQLARERLLRILAEANDCPTLPDGHYLIALSAFFESLSAYVDAGTSGRAAAAGIPH